MFKIKLKINILNGKRERKIELYINDGFSCVVCVCVVNGIIFFYFFDNDIFFFFFKLML